MVSSKVIFAIFATIGLLALFMYVTPGSKRALLGSVNYDSSHEETWRQFQVFTKDFNKTYRSLEEMNDRFNIFHDNFYWIQVENQRSLSVKYAINHFTDLTQEEFRNNYLGYKEDPSQEIIYEEEEDIQVQGSIDWVQKGAVTHVKNQGQCGSCWAFSAVGSLEGAYFLKKGSLVSFSEQELVDCSGSYGNNGCNGGWMNSAFKYWQDHGEEKESDYPYKANEGNCKQTKSKAVTKVSKHVGVKPNEASLKKALNSRVISVAVDASGWSHYSSGIYDNDCSTNLNHGVTLVGYGSHDGKDYWRIKNSWSSSWGEKGFIRLKRTDSSSSKGKCGVAAAASYPVI